MKMISRKKINRVVIPLVLLSIFLVSSLMLTMIISAPGRQVNTTEGGSVPPMASVAEYETPIVGMGANRTLRLFLNQNGTTEGIDKFNVTSASDEEYLSEAQLNITLSKSFNTTYWFEDDTPLQYPKAKYTSPYVNATVNTGTLTGGDLNNINNDDSLSADLASNTQQVNLEIVADFSASTIPNTSVLGFVITVRMGSDSPVGLNISGYDSQEDNWDVLNTDEYNITQNTGAYYTFYLINKNLRYINDTQAARFQLNFQNATLTSEFNLNIFYVSVAVVQGQEVPINAGQKVALEFNTLGNCTVYGFQTWIRSFNVNAADQTSNLTIRLYHTNRTVPLARSELLAPGEINAIPNETGVLFAENSYINFTGDEPIWFNFTADFSGIELNVSDFFIVITANVSGAAGEKGFSLVTLPNYSPDPTTILADKDNRIDHLLLTQTTGDWELVKLTSYDVQCDASPFVINLTRPYRPSEIDLNIEGHYFSDAYIQDYPHDEVNPYYRVFWWGLGTISHQFQTPVKSNNGNFTVELSWDTEQTASIQFSVDYLVTKYFDENATTQYNLTIDSEPQWSINYTLDRTQYPGWTFKEMWFFTPLDWTIHNLFVKGVDYLVNATYEYNYNGQHVLKVSNDTIVGLPENGDTTYTVNATSPNYIKECALNLHYKDYEWKTNGFMIGDNISVSLGVLDSEKKYVSSGTAQVSLYDTEGQLMAGHTFTDNAIDINATYSTYFFEKQNILETNSSTEEGEYWVVSSWTNGEEAGIQLTPFYVGKYSGNILDVTYDEETGVNQVWGQVNPVKTDTSLYNFNIYAIKTADQLTPEDYIINQSIELSLGQNLTMIGFLQNESLLNAGEDVNVQIRVKNEHELINYDLKIEVQLIYANKEEWIITNTTSASQNLAVVGDPNGDDEKTFSVNLTIPTVEEGGYNCPIRDMPMKIKILFYVGGDKIAEIIRDEDFYYSSLPEDQFEGKVVSLSQNEDRVGPSFIASLNRTQLELPANITYILQIFNNYYMTTDEEIKTIEYSKINGEITNVTTLQTNLNRSSTVNITGVAVDEYNRTLSGVSLMTFYQNGTEWDPLFTLEGSSTIRTDENGYFNIPFDLSQTPYGQPIVFMFKFLGNDTHLAFETEKEIMVNTYNNSIEIGTPYNTLIADKDNLIHFTIRNTGNSTLSNFTITITSSDFQYTLTEIPQTTELAPGEALSVPVIFYKDSYKWTSANVSITVNYYSVEDAYQFSKDTKVEFKVFRANEDAIFTVVGLSAFFVGVALIWVYSAKYITNTLKELKKLPEESAPKKSKSAGRRRTGKYVKISELSRKDVETESDKSKEKESASLDDLIEEAGLNKDEK